MLRLVEEQTKAGEGAWLLTFPHEWPAEVRARFVAAAEKALDAKDVPLVAEILRSSENWELQYACLRILYRIHANGVGLPSTDVFRSDRTRYIADILSRLGV